MGSRYLLDNPFIRLTLHCTARHRCPDVALEAFPVGPQVLGSLLVQRVARIGLEEEELQADDDGVQVEYGLPVLAQNVKAHLAFQVDIGVVDLFAALHLGRLVREVGCDVEGEAELAALVHALVRLDVEDEVEDIVWVRELGLHCAA